MLFFTIGAIYLVYLVYLLIRAYSELRAMPYFGKHLNFLFSSYSNSQWKVQFLFIAVTTNSLLYTDLYFQYCETEMATTSNSCKHKQCSNGTVMNALKLINFKFDLTLSECPSCKYPLKTLHGKTGNLVRKIKWFAIFCLGRFRKYGLWFEAMQFFWSFEFGYTL